MTILAEFSAVDRFQNLVTRTIGMRFEDDKTHLLADVLQRRVQASGLEPHTYLDYLESGATVGERDALAHAFTVPETYFFRNVEQFDALRVQAIPDCLQRLGGQRPLRILSAGCATGEEPYSIAILLREMELDFAAQVELRAFDINPKVLERAAQAHFSAWALRGTDASVQQRWFHVTQRAAVLDDSIRQAVKFEQRNLIDDDGQFWQPDRFDVIFCRNVLMYFTSENMARVVARFTRALAPGGYLFLGHAETLRGLSQDFHLHHTHGTFYYQRKGGPVEPLAADGKIREPLAWTTPAPIDDGWMDAIAQAAERIRRLSVPVPEAPAPAAPQGWDLAPAFQLLQQERFAEALAAVLALPQASMRDADVLLLHAVLLVHLCQIGDAQQVCEKLLALDEFNAGAHYVLALCRERAGSVDDAAEHDRIAVYLDPAFAMPRLHLGLLARRAGNYVRARAELQQALVLLQREDVARLLLFGGGFNRDTLIALCQAELDGCGGCT